MKALSVRQPWAFAIVSGAKNFENRTWSTNYRGPLAIHAGKKEDSEAIGEVMYNLSIDLDIPMELLQQLYEEDLRHLGGFVGIVNMVDCVHEAEVTKQPHDSHWFNGPYGFRFDPKRTVIFPEMIPSKGQLGIYDFPFDLAAECFKGYPAASYWKQFRKWHQLDPDSRNQS